MTRTPGAAFRSRARRYIADNAPRFERELGQLVAIPSVSSCGTSRAEMWRCARWLARHLQRVGCTEAHVVATGGHPAVLATSPRSGAGPRVLVYGHYDVQPAAPLAAWRTPPFEPVIQGGYLYGRGASDDKGQVFAHIKAFEMLRDLEGLPPHDVVFLIEGEEEIGSPHLAPLLRRFRRQLESDVAIVSDTPALGPQRPSITYGLRGDLYLDVDVSHAAGDLHSGNFGGAVPNPLRALVSALSRLHDRDGHIAVPGFADDIQGESLAERDYMRDVGPADAQIQRESGAAMLAGEPGYSAYERLTIRPSLEIAGLTGGYTGTGVKGVIPSRAHAKLDVRLVPRQQPERVHRQLFDFLARAMPAGVRLTTRERMRSLPVVLEREHPFSQLAAQACQLAFGTAPVFMRSGGSIPVVSLFSLLLAVPSLLLGFALPDDRPHAPNERMSLSMLAKGILASALILRGRVNP